MDSDPVSTKFDFRSINNDKNFNSLIMQAFMCGIYTLLFMQALWKLFEKKSIKLYMMAVTSLWVSVLSEFVIIGHVDRQNPGPGIAMQNSSPTPIVLGDDGVGAVSTLLYVSEMLAPMIANGLMVWRCTVVWNGNRWIFLALILLLVGSTVGNVWGVMSQYTSSNLANLVSGVSEIASAMTTLTATALITLKIILVTRNSPRRSAYQRIIQIVIESAALSSFILLLVGAFELTDVRGPFDLRTKLGLGEDAILDYAGALTGPLLGIAPTLIAFRVAEENSQTDVHSTSPLSRLIFWRSRPSKGSDELSGQPSTHPLGSDHGEGSVAIKTLNVEAQNGVVNVLSGTSSEVVEKEISHSALGLEYASL